MVYSSGDGLFQQEKQHVVLAVGSGWHSGSGATYRPAAAGHVAPLVAPPAPKLLSPFSFEFEPSDHLHAAQRRLSAAPTALTVPFEATSHAAAPVNLRRSGPQAGFVSYAQPHSKPAAQWKYSAPHPLVTGGQTFYPMNGNPQFATRSHSHEHHTNFHASGVGQMPLLSRGWSGSSSGSHGSH